MGSFLDILNAGQYVKCSEKYKNENCLALFNSLFPQMVTQWTSCSHITITCRSVVAKNTHRATLHGPFTPSSNC